MIIYSNDEKSFINSEYLYGAYICKDQYGLFRISAVCNCGDRGITIGDYNTEQAAKNALKSLMTAITSNAETVFYMPKN
ncbi:MAG: hypothetical protein IJ583_16510 [Firmicutes bacterium]|nr:hypothetical protein [Bacillota bacterium]